MNENENPQPAEAGPSRGPSVEEVPRLMTRRLVSQSTFHEDTLNNSVLNTQQQFIDMDDLESSSDDNESDTEDPEQLFEEYLRESAEATRSQAHLFNDELPMEHSYLGKNMDVVRGTNIFEPGKVYELPLCHYHSLVFPGEIFPMIMIPDRVFTRNPESNEGLTFGLVFADASSETHENKVFGVTCQVFEKGLDDHGHITVKSKAHQRFELIDIEDSLGSFRHNSFYAKVKILPEYMLPEPIHLSMSDNLMKFIHNPSQSQRIKSFLSSSSRWPSFVYDQYSITVVNEKIDRFLAMLSIRAPSDPSQKSFWLARNVPLNQSDRLKIFTSNCVNKRMLLIADSLNFVSPSLCAILLDDFYNFYHSQMCFFDCKRCKTQIASYSDIFAMAKGNVNANYCNPAGYIHETLTVHKTSEDALVIVDRPSTEFSWFPGYAWQIAVCSTCQSHIGWKFSALTKHLKPKSFYGLSCKSLQVSPQGKKKTNDASVSDDSSTDEN